MEVKALDNLVDMYHENKLSHAYLLETNNVEKCFNDLKIVIKKIFCQSEFNESCSKCNICNLIDQGYLPSLMVIQSEGNTIKKEQVLELKRAFSSMPVYTKENIYVIKNAEKLNDASANTMLKFIEEPEDNIMGFFITNNINNVISTIRSRCEIIKVNYGEDNLVINILNEPENKTLIDTCREYLLKLEVEKTNSIMYNRDVLLNKFSEKDDIKKIFNVMLLVYQEVLNDKLGLAVKTDISSWSFLSNKTTSELIKRINLVIQFLEDLDSNANLELLLDKFVIELGE